VQRRGKLDENNISYKNSNKGVNQLSSGKKSLPIVREKIRLSEQY